ncbi:MAG: arylsulfatase A [Cyclobacteriaceae bacterium]|jgi:arylsulfatase A-like enzyme
MLRFRGTSKAEQYGDYIQELDYHVGEITSLLDELGLAENTLLVFTVITEDNLVMYLAREKD